MDSLPLNPRFISKYGTTMPIREATTLEAALEKVTGALLFKSGMISFFGFVILPPSFM